MNNFENNVFKPKEKNTKWYFWLFIALLGALLLSNLAGETIKNLFNALLSGLTPIIVAVTLAFILLHPIRWIEEKLLKNAFVGNPRAKSIKRAISLTICYAVIIGIVVVLLLTMIPYVMTTLQELSENSDVIVNDLEAQITSLIVSLTGLPVSEVEGFLTQFLSQMGTTISGWFVSISDSLINIVSVVANIIFVIFMSMLISFLMLKDKELIGNAGRRYTYAYNNKRKADEIIVTTRRSRKMLDQWLVCNLIMMAVIFVVAWIGYAIIGVQFAFLLALLLAILSIIPYIGGFIAMVPVIMVVLVFGTTSQLLASVIFGLATWAIITTVLPPFIMSNRLKTRAVILLFTLVIGGAMFGLWGMLLSGPVAAILTIFMQERLEVREAVREREELLEAGITDVPTAGISDMLDLQEDIDPTVLDIIVEERPKMKRKVIGEIAKEEKEKLKEEKLEKKILKKKNNSKTKTKNTKKAVNKKAIKKVEKKAESKTKIETNKKVDNKKVENKTKIETNKKIDNKKETKTDKK